MNRPQSLHRRLCNEINELRLSGALPPKWAKKVTEQLNQKERDKPIKQNTVCQVGQGKFYNEEIATAIYYLAENNNAKNLLEKVQAFLRKQNKATSILFPFFLLTSIFLSAQNFDTTNYKTNPDFAQKLNSFSKSDSKTISDKYHVCQFPTRLRITEVESILGYDSQPIIERRMIPTNVYYRPFQEDDFYLVQWTKSRMMSVSILARWEGEYYVEILDNQQPALIKFDTRKQDVEILYNWN